jgi:hypothetical protein
MMIGALGALVLTCGLSRQLAAQSGGAHRATFPKACYFFTPRKEDVSQKRADERELPDERAYDATVTEVYRQWCTASPSSPDKRKAAVVEMVKRWKAVWERDDPYDAAFHETAAFDLLALLGITYELPSSMAGDPRLIQEWTEDCQYTCFTIWGDPTKPADQKGILMLLQLRNDLTDHLKKEPATEPIFDMLWNAQFTLEH